MYLIVGLGNPGAAYKNTRHNVGFKVIDLWSRDLGIRLTKRRFQSRNTLTRYKDKSLIFLCPLTFMNRSGASVRACSDYFDLDTRDILVVHDDLDLMVGRIKVARNGGNGGHRGVASIIKHLGTTQFPRVKIGIGRPRYNETVENYVLRSFYEDEKDTMENILSIAVKACKLFVSEGVEAAMNTINCQRTTSIHLNTKIGH